MEVTVTDALPLTIRPVMPDDAFAVADLSGQLGYRATAEEMHERILALTSCEANRAVFVACVAQEVVGWIDVALTFHIQIPTCALIGGLVVKEGLRGLRIGKLLCDEVEAWAQVRGVSVVRVTSRSTRDDAHRFYLREGYTDVKTSRVFEKILR